MKPKMKFAAAAVMLLVAMLVVPAFGTAATDNVNTPQRSGDYLSVTQGSNIVFAGTLVGLTNGVALPAADLYGLKVIGRAERYSDNKTTATYSATKTLTVQRGTFRWANGASGSVFTAADIGSLAYVLDDSTVTSSANTTTNIIAGLIVDVDTNGVWVDTFSKGSAGASVVTTLAASGNATVGGTLAVTGATTITGALSVTGAVTAASTIAATGFKIGAAAGYSGAVTNGSVGGTNILTFVGGICTNKTTL